MFSSSHRRLILKDFLKSSDRTLDAAHSCDCGHKHTTNSPHYLLIRACMQKPMRRSCATVVLQIALG